MSEENYQELSLLENGSEKCKVLLLKLKKPKVTKRKNMREIGGLSGRRIPSEMSPGEALISSRIELTNGEKYQLPIGLDTYDFIINKTKEHFDKDDEVFFIARGDLKL